jgi:hypothetical protein
MVDSFDLFSEKLYLVIRITADEIALSQQQKW